MQPDIFPAGDSLSNWQACWERILASQTMPRQTAVTLLSHRQGRWRLFPQKNIRSALIIQNLFVTLQPEKVYS